MAKIRLTKEFRFEMAHALWNYDGHCRNIHGHSYILHVTVLGKPINDSSNPKYGMVMDFGDLKSLVNREIIDKLDHAIVFNKRVPKSLIEQMGQMAERHLMVDYQPTCENLLLDFVERLTKQLPQGVKLHSLKLFETESSFAEWHASDNE